MPAEGSGSRGPVCIDRRPRTQITIAKTNAKRRLLTAKREEAAQVLPAVPQVKASSREAPAVPAPSIDPESYALLASLLAMPSKTWSLGSFGAIAEFMWAEDEATTAAELVRLSPRGGIRIVLPRGVSIVQYTTPSIHPERRRRELALCLPLETCGMSHRTVVTEIGPDVDALRDKDRRGILFDVGLGRLQVDCYVRTSDPTTLRALRKAEGLSLFDAGNALAAAMPALSPHRVFVSKCGRIEVYQPIPAVDERSPDGPHTHVLPKLLRTGRTHGANIPLPIGLVPCLTAHLSRPEPDHAMRLDDAGLAGV